MNKNSKQWFESPLIKYDLQFFYQENPDLFSSGKLNSNDRQTILTPSYNSKPVQIQKNRQSPYHSSLYSTSQQSNKFDDVSLPNMYSNAKVEKFMIEKKIDFEDSSVIEEQDDYVTPERQQIQKDQNSCTKKNYQPETSAKKSSSNFSYFQQKKGRPKEKGLKILSQKAYSIILRLNGATYKEVATVLVKQLASEDGIDIDDKDEQNIKRRVYDALNVLIALGTLKKDGRKIFGVSRCKDYQIQLKTAASSLLQKLIFKKSIISGKLTVLQNLKRNKQSIKALIKRNVSNPVINQKIDFPFIAVSLQDSTEGKIRFNSNKAEINSSEQILRPFGDADSIPFLRNVLKPFIQ